MTCFEENTNLPFVLSDSSVMGGLVNSPISITLMTNAIGPRIRKTEPFLNPKLCPLNHHKMEMAIAWGSQGFLSKNQIVSLINSRGSNHSEVAIEYLV